MYPFHTFSHFEKSNFSCNFSKTWDGFTLYTVEITLCWYKLHMDTTFIRNAQYMHSQVNCMTTLQLGEETQVNQ
jgi:hypothetical protein